MSNDNNKNELSHYYWVIPIVLFIIAQSSIAIWWAGQLDSSVQNLQSSIVNISKDVDDENLKQWVIINKNQDTINSIKTQIATTNIELKNINTNFDKLEEQMAENNRLLRQLLTTNPIR